MLKKIWVQISNLGVSSDMPHYKQKSIILFNQIIRILFFIIIAMIAVLKITVDAPLKDLVFLWILPFISLSLFLNIKGRVITSAFIIAITGPLTSLIGSLVLRNDIFGDSVAMMILPRIGIIISTLIPTVILGIENKKRTFLCVLTGLLCLIFYDKVHQLAGFNSKHLTFSSAHYPMIIAGTWAVFVVFGSLMFFMQRINLFYDNLTNEQKNEITIQRDRLSIRNTEIELQKEEITTQLELIEQQRDALVTRNDEILNQKKQITDSIVYALRIQEAVLPNLNFLEQHFKGSYLINIPRDIVSGDFYWFKKIGDHVLVADCTGHGVPGAFMSMLCISVLNEIYDIYKFRHNNLNEEVIHPNLILDELKEMLQTRLHQDPSADSRIRDGLDIGLCVFAEDLKTVEYASVNRPLYVVRGDTLIEIVGNSTPTGIYLKKDARFDNHIFELQTGDRLYLSSDGFISQFGGPKNEKLKSKRFKEILFETKSLPINEQGESVKESFYNWKGEERQIDDILVLGVEV